MQAAGNTVSTAQGLLVSVTLSDGKQIPRQDGGFPGNSLSEMPPSVATRGGHRKHTTAHSRIPATATETVETEVETEVEMVKAC